MIKVKFLKSHPAYGYFAGDEAEINEKAAAGLLESKHVEEINGGVNNEAEEGLEAARLRFEELTGEKPGNRKLETLQKAIVEAEEKAKK